LKKEGPTIQQKPRANQDAFGTSRRVREKLRARRGARDAT
jgi:hypothetical protein